MKIMYKELPIFNTCTTFLLISRNYVSIYLVEDLSLQAIVPNMLVAYISIQLSYRGRNLPIKM